jgi:formate hydrogenlyase subunit 4
MIQLLQIAVILAAAPLLGGILRTLRARLQNRPGPSVGQPYRELRKLWSKEAIVAHRSSIVLTAPGIVLGVALTFVTIVPAIVPAQNSAAQWRFDAVTLALLLALGRFVLVLAALDTGSAFEGMAASREITFASLTEAPLIIALLGSGFLGHATLGATPGDLWTDALSAGALVLVMLSETARVPVDNQETHYELTMIHEGLVLEYSGWQLAALQYAAYLRQAAFFVLAAELMPGTGLVTLAWLAGLVVVIAGIETLYAKVRLFEVPQIFASALILAVAGVGLRIAEIVK